MIGAVVFITALIAQVWIWDIFGHFKMVRSLDQTLDQSVPSSGNVTNETNYSRSCTDIDKCECKLRKIDVSFHTGDLARKHVEIGFRYKLLIRSAGTDSVQIGGVTLGVKIF